MPLLAAQGRPSRSSRTRPTATRRSGFTHEQWQYAFTNTFSEEESRRLYERYPIPASGRILFDSVLANLKPGHQETWVDYKNDDRAPLLFVSGSEDHLMPPKIQASNAKHYKSDTITEVKELRGLRAPAPARRRAGRRSPTTPSTGQSSTRSAPRRRRSPDHAHRRADRPARDRGWRILTDPTFDAPGRTTRSAGARRRPSSPGRPSARPSSPPLDAVLLSHDHHADNLDDAGPRPAARRRRDRHHRLWRAPARRTARGLDPWETTRLEARGGRRSKSRPPPADTARRSSTRSWGRDRLRARVGGAGARRALDLGRHRPLRRRARGGGPP